MKASVRWQVTDLSPSAEEHRVCTIMVLHLPFEPRSSAAMHLHPSLYAAALASARMLPACSDALQSSPCLVCPLPARAWLPVFYAAPYFRLAVLNHGFLLFVSCTLACCSLKVNSSKRKATQSGRAGSERLKNGGMEEPREVVFGQIVWAHVTGFPWWPALVARNGASWTSDKLDSPQWKHKGKYWVLFYNDNDEGSWVPKNQMRVFSQRSIELFNPTTLSKKHKDSVIKALQLAIADVRARKWVVNERRLLHASKQEHVFADAFQKLAQHGEALGCESILTIGADVYFASSNRTTSKRPSTLPKRASRRSSGLSEAGDMVALNLSGVNPCSVPTESPVMTSKHAREAAASQNGDETETDNDGDSAEQPRTLKRLRLTRQMYAIRRRQLQARVRDFEVELGRRWTMAHAGSPQQGLFKLASEIESRSMSEIQARPSSILSLIGPKTLLMAAALEKVSVLAERLFEARLCSGELQAEWIMKVLNENVGEQFRSSKLFVASATALAEDASSWHQAR
ncbi:hypothetical protein FVE85_0438 [Porphyridium purpureum]|uniref:PWWP domain-containing protein n=1 Tax=Porphyridium purpureum TaxID=35688 RepID=A0A5J4YYM3_PORPP|nr:hypothetical protein FVE85_0438 [Porphyridium purpureum]|eukprot:POR0431..scf208_2